MNWKMRMMCLVRAFLSFEKKSLLLNINEISSLFFAEELKANCCNNIVFSAEGQAVTGVVHDCYACERVLYIFVLLSLGMNVLLPMFLIKLLFNQEN